MGSSEQLFNDHVVMEEPENCSPIWDKIIGTMLILCALFGAPANLLALKFFRTTKRMGDLTAGLYIAISCVDICTCIAQIPVALSLLSNRYPVLFNNMVFCAAWIVFVEFFHRISMFLVMLLSDTRCIAIALPNAARNIKKKRDH